MSRFKPPRVARIEANERYYALNSHPNFRTFKAPEWVDAFGREYRVSPVAGAEGSGEVQLDVRLPRRTVPWFDPMEDGRPIVLTRTDGSAQQREVRVLSSFLMNPKHRTGHVFIWAQDWA